MTAAELPESPIAEKPPPVKIGQIVDKKYRVDALLGSGGMGEVYRARHLGTGRDVALKVIARHLTARPRLIERFRREALAVGRLRHDNIVNILDFGITSTDAAPLAYLAMEILEGETLDNLIDRQGCLPLPLVMELARQIATAVDAAHCQGVLHRDLKPANVWIAPNGPGGFTAKILDFGVAKLMDVESTGAGNPESASETGQLINARPDPALTQQGTRIGSPAYMSPEQRRGEPLDKRTDIYSFGVMVYQMLTGRMPERDPRALEQLDVDMSLEVLSCVRWALAASPASRPRTADAFYVALRVSAGGQSLLAADTRQFSRQRTSRHRRIVDALHLGLGTTALGILWVLSLANPLQTAGRFALAFGVCTVVFGLALLSGWLTTAFTARDITGSYDEPSPVRLASVMRTCQRVVGAMVKAGMPRRRQSPAARGLLPAVAGVETEGVIIRSEELAQPVAALAVASWQRSLWYAGLAVLLFEAGALGCAAVLDATQPDTSAPLYSRILSHALVLLVALVVMGAVARTLRRNATLNAVLYVHCRRAAGEPPGSFKEAPFENRSRNLRWLISGHWVRLAAALGLVAALWWILAVVALPRAVRGEAVRTVRVLVSMGLPVDPPRLFTSDRPLLDLATSPRQSIIVALLLDAGADVNAASNTGRTPLMAAAIMGSTASVQLLLERGADVTRTDRHGRAAVHFATWRGSQRPMTIRLLLEHGADVNARDAKGTTPLMTSVRLEDDPATVRLLLSHGADPRATDNFGQTALDLAREKGHRKVIALLESSEH